MTNDMTVCINEKRLRTATFFLVFTKTLVPSIFSTFPMKKNYQKIHCIDRQRMQNSKMQMQLECAVRSIEGYIQI